MMQRRTKYDWLLFDADNTILDFDSAAARSFADTTRDNNLSQEPEHFAIYKKVNSQIWREFEEGKISAKELRVKRFQLFLEETGQDGNPEQLNTFFLKRLIKHSELFKGARQLLHFLQARYNLAIITNGLKEVQRPRFEKVEITKYFRAIVVSDEIGISKPHQGFFDFTFQEIGNPAKEKVLVIGDSLSSDIRGGINYDLDTCWLNTKELEHIGDPSPTYIISALSGLRDIL